MSEGQAPLFVVDGPIIKPEPLAVAKLSAAEICERLVKRHSAPEWSTFVELRCGTGYAGYRYETSDQRLDLFTVNTWPSKRYRSIAYEVKVTRGDFRRELSDPSKRQFAERVANECYFAVPAGLVRPHEVPDGWGLIESWGAERMRITKEAEVRTPEPWPMYFIASMLRRGSHERNSRLDQ